MLPNNKRWRMVYTGEGERGSIQKLNFLSLNKDQWKPIRENLVKRLIELREKGISTGTQVVRHSRHEVLIRGGSVLIRYSVLTRQIEIIANTTRNTDFLPLTIDNLVEIQEECRKWNSYIVRYKKEVFE